MRTTAALAASVAVALVIVAPRASVVAGENAPSDSCKIASAGIGSGGNTVTCNFGLTPEQLKQLTEAAVKGATEPLAHQIVDISKTLGVTEDSAEKLLKIVGEDPNIPADRLAEALSKVAADYQRLQVQVAALNPDNPTAKALVEQAKPEIDVGHFQRAHELLRQATQAQIAAAQEARKLREQAQSAEDAQMLGAASSTAAEGDVAMTERRYGEAADLFSHAADYVPAGHAKEHAGYLRREAEALYQQGDERGDNDALRNCIATYERALSEYPRSVDPLEWSLTQNNLANSLVTLGERESGTEKFEEAVGAFRAALEERTRERVPLEWAETQHGLGAALMRIGERENGEAWVIRFREAVAAYRSALEERTRDRVPLDWAATQHRLGNVLMRLSELGEWDEDEEARLAEAIAAYRSALQERTRDRVPLDWATTQTALASALARLGERAGKTEGLEQAIATYREALEEETRARVPLRWAKTQILLGNALEELDDLENALWAIRELSRESDKQESEAHEPEQSSRERENGTGRLKEAVSAYDEALKEMTPERVPRDWARAFGSQGALLAEIAYRTEDGAAAAAAVQQIAKAYEAAQRTNDELLQQELESQLTRAQDIYDAVK
jgi:tetratricopeptide (TPR) repeat protein